MDFQKQDKKIIVPSVVLAEFLAGEETTHYQYLESQISHQLRIMPFDAKCAFIAGQLWNKLKDHIEIYKESFSSETNNRIRQKIKVDHQVIATAKANNCISLISDDDQIHQIASQTGLIRTSRIPDLPDEQVLLPVSQY